MKKIRTPLCSIIVLVLVLANEAHEHEPTAAASTSAFHWSGPQPRFSGGRDDVTYSENSEVTNPPRSILSVLDTKSSLLPLRHRRELDEDGGGGNSGVPNLSAYHVRFETCQVEEDHHDGSCPDDDTGSCIETRRFVVFRLCSNACLGSGIGAADACCGGDDDDDGSSYGEYVADLGDYLEAVVAQYQEEQERYCDSCEEDCNEYDAYKPDCMCREECERFGSMEENGYIDATEFIQCQMVYGRDNAAYFAGPVCSSDGAKIKIGVFLDEQCTREAMYRDVEDYLFDGDGYRMKLSHAILKKTYTGREDEFLSCHAPKEAAGETSEGCQVLHHVSAKCKPEDSFLPQHSWNQHAEQDIVCGTIAKLKEGPIVNNGEEESHLIGAISTSSRMTGRQKLLLIISSSGIFVLAVY